jgi:hypothetical protein
LAQRFRDAQSLRVRATAALVFGNFYGNNPDDGGGSRKTGHGVFDHMARFHRHSLRAGGSNDSPRQRQEWQKILLVETPRLATFGARAFVAMRG